MTQGLILVVVMLRIWWLMELIEECNLCSRPKTNFLQEMVAEYTFYLTLAE